jgi:DNA-binding transcriptional ArsR family regulator
MKTTVDIADALLEEAKEVARADRVTLRELIECGLRRELEARAARPAFRWHLKPFRGHGLRPEFREGGWERIRDAIYGERL